MTDKHPALSAAGKKGGEKSSRAGIPNKKTLEAIETMKGKGYNPIVSLLESRETRVANAKNFLAKARIERVPEVRLAYLALAEKQVSEAERIDIALLPYRFSKLSPTELKQLTKDNIESLKQAIMETSSVYSPPQLKAPSVNVKKNKVKKKKAVTKKASKKKSSKRTPKTRKGKW